MLAAIEDDGSVRDITDIPHRQAYRTWRKRLPEADYRAIRAALHRVVDKALERGEPVTTSWVPGSDWGGTPYAPIYNRACRQDPDAAAKFFGLLFWEVMMERPEWWSFGRYEDAHGHLIEGLTYFQIDR